MSNCHPLEVVCRGSETQLQVGENFNQIPWRVKGLTFLFLNPIEAGNLLTQLSALITDARTQSVATMW